MYQYLTLVVLTIVCASQVNTTDSCLRIVCSRGVTSRCCPSGIRCYCLNDWPICDCYGAENLTAVADCVKVNCAKDVESTCCGGNCSCVSNCPQCMYNNKAYSCGSKVSMGLNSVMQCCDGMWTPCTQWMNKWNCKSCASQVKVMDDNCSKISCAHGTSSICCPQNHSANCGCGMFGQALCKCSYD